MGVRPMPILEWSDRAPVRDWKPILGGPIEVKDPATGQPIGRVVPASAADLAAKQAAAGSAQTSHAPLPWTARARVIPQAAAARRAMALATAAR